MSRAPASITQQSRLRDAVALMREHAVRHLPVMEGEDARGRPCFRIG
ncbi:MAG: CBS domain-containing protein [Polyangiales bacterium]